MRKALPSYVSLFALILFTLLFAACSNSVNDSPGEASSVGVSAVSTPTSVDLNLNNLEGAEYKVTRLNSTGKKLDEKISKENNIAFDNLKEGESYVFLVETDNESTYAFATTNKGAQPSRIGAVALDGAAKIIWESVPGAVEYELFISESVQGEYVTLGCFESTYTIIDNLENGVTYFFKVQAIFEKNDRDFEIQKIANINSELGRKRLLAAQVDTDANITNLSVSQAYEFAIPTAVTPGAASMISPAVDIPENKEFYIRHLFAIKRGNEVHFSWDALNYAKSYRFKHSPDNKKYETLAEITSNSYILKLPVTNPYYRVAGYFFNLFEGPLSQYIRLQLDNSIETPDWKAYSGNREIKVENYNFSAYDKVKVFCTEVGGNLTYNGDMNESVTYLKDIEGARFYDCKLKVFKDDLVAESDIQRVHVYDISTDDDVKMMSTDLVGNRVNIVFTSKEDLVYHIFVVGNSNYPDTPNYVIKAGPGIVTEFTIRNLECDTLYQIVVEEDGNPDPESSQHSNEFFLDKNYCNSIKTSIKKLSYIGDLPPLISNDPHTCTLSNSSAVAYNDTIYIVTYNGIYNFNPEKSLWTKLNSEVGLNDAPIGIHSNMLYIFGGQKSDTTNADNLYILDLNQNRFINKPLPIALPHFTGLRGAFILNKFYLPLNKTMYIYDADNNEWEQKKLVGSYPKSIAAFELNGLFYHVQKDSDKLYYYDPQTGKEGVTDLWQNKINDSAIGVYSGNLYRFGGIEPLHDTDINEKFYNDFDVFNFVKNKSRKLKLEGEVPLNVSQGTLNGVKDNLYWIGPKSVVSCTNDVYSLKL